MAHVAWNCADNERKPVAAANRPTRSVLRAFHTFVLTVHLAIGRDLAGFGGGQIAGDEQFYRTGSNIALFKRSAADVERTSLVNVTGRVLFPQEEARGATGELVGRTSRRRGEPHDGGKPGTCRHLLFGSG